MDVFDRTREVLDREYMLRWLGVPPTDTRYAAVQRALSYLRQLDYDAYLEAVQEFQRDNLPGGPYPPPSVPAYDFLPSS